MPTAEEIRDSLDAALAAAVGPSLSPTLRAGMKARLYTVIGQGLAGLDWGATPLSNAAPEALGTASSGTATAAARADHVHAYPGVVIAAEVTAVAGLTVSEAMSTHTSAPDPHEQYALESALGDAAARNVGTGSGDVAAGNAPAAAQTAAESTAASALSSHVGAADPHPGYVLESDVGATGAALLASATAGTARTALGLALRVEIVGQWYPAAAVNPGTLAAQNALAPNLYRAMPWIAPRTGTVDALMIDVTTAVASSSAVIAIWSDAGGKPGTVLGEVTVSTATTGMRSGAVSVTLVAGQLCWSTILNSHTNIILRGPPQTDWIATLGYAGATNNAQIKLDAAVTYASPTPAWPASYAIADSTTGRACIFYRWGT